MQTDKITLIIDLSDILVKAIPKLVLKPVKNVIEKLSLFYPDIVHKYFSYLEDTLSMHQTHLDYFGTH